MLLSGLRRLIAQRLALSIGLVVLLSAFGSLPDSGAGARAGARSDGAPGISGPSIERNGPRFIPGELLVRFASDATPKARAAVAARAGGARARGLPVPGLELVRLRPGTAVRSAAAAFERDPKVLYAEPNYIYKITAAPNDPRFAELWGLSNTGQTVGGRSGTPDSDIDAPEAWDITTGRSHVIVAVADTGLAYDHPDIGANVWTNRGERGRRANNGRDDDGNGRTDDWRGWDFVGRDNDPRDLNGHGTHVAGTIGARGNNGAGIPGVAWRVRMMPLRVADTGGAVTSATAISAFDYAGREGARVVNASFASDQASDALLDAVRRNPRVLFVTSAGNGGEDGVGDNNDYTLQYPCGFSAPNLICVAAADRADGLAPFSNFGARSVDIAAPGVATLSTTPPFGPPLLKEDFENDISGTWVTGGINSTWARITTVAASGLYSLSDSPGTAYLDNTDSFVRTAAPFSLSGRAGCQASYALRLSTEPEVDKLLLELSPDAIRWVGVSDLSGTTGGSFRGITEDLSPFETWSSVFLRFRLSTNSSVVADGAQIDEVEVRCLGSTYSGNDFSFEDGTSMAAPHVSGTAALILSRYPGIGVAGVRRAILRGVDVKPALAGKTVTGGRVNARRALEIARDLLPRLELSGPSKQRGTRTGSILVFARCSKRCALAGRGELTFPGASARTRLKRVRGSLSGAGRKRLRIRFTRKALARARRALARRRPVRAVIAVTASDSKGNSVVRRREVRLSR